MRRELTSADKMKLVDRIKEFGHEYFGDPLHYPQSELYGLAKVFADFYEEQNTFMDAISDAQKPRIFKIPFNKQWLECLQILEREGRPMTTPMLASALVRAGINPLYAKQVARYFVNVRHWNLIEKTGETQGNADFYRLTSYGRQAAEMPHTTIIKRFIYTMRGNVTPTPDGKPEPDHIAISEVTFLEKRSREEHVHDSAALAEQTQPNLFV